MAKILYEVYKPNGTEDTVYVGLYPSKSIAKFIAKNEKAKWERIFVVHPNDRIIPDDRTSAFYEGDMLVFVNNEQNTYALCPWGGTATELVSDDKYTLYRTNNYEYSGEEGFYLVDQNPKLK